MKELGENVIFDRIKEGSDLYSGFSSWQRYFRQLADTIGFPQ